MAIKRILIAAACLAALAPALVPEQAEADGNRKKIALVMKALSNPFFITMRDGAAARAEKIGVPLEVFGIERETEADRQIGIVENLISRKYGALVIAPADSKKLIPVCKKALDRGIHVINIDNPFHQETLAEHGLSIPFVGSDNKAGAAMAGEYIRRKLNGRGKAVIIEGIRGVENADLRKEGFIEALTAEGDIEIAARETANWHSDEAFAVMAKIVQERGAGVDAVLCANDNMALGVIQALDQAGLAGKVLIGAYDNIEEARLAMRNKMMHATIEQHPELMGAFGVDLAAAALAGKTPPAYKATPLDLVTCEGFGKTIALSLSNLGNPFFRALRDGAARAAALFGADLVTADAGDDDVSQLLSLKRFVKEGADMIILNPTNAETVTPAMELARAGGVPLMTVDRKSARPDLVLSHVASDNLAGGRMAGEFIAKRLSGKGRVLEVEGIPGTSAAHDRGTGFNEVMRRFPGIEVVRDIADFDREKARALMTRQLKEGFRADAVFAHNDEMILGVVAAYEAMNVEPPRTMAGFDATADALKALAAGRLTATIAQDPEEMGWQSVRAAVRAFRGETPPALIHVDLHLVTASQDGGAGP